MLPPADDGGGARARSLWGGDRKKALLEEVLEEPTCELSLHYPAQGVSASAAIFLGVGKEKGFFPTPISEDRLGGLPGGAMVAQGPLEPLIMVRIHAGQPKRAPASNPLAAGLFRAPCGFCRRFLGYKQA
jgi:hypothetical protein